MTTDIELAHLAMPIANESNKQLEGEVATRRKEIDRLEVQIEQNKDRVQIIKDHLKNVRQELQLTQALYDARKNDVETESHMKQLAERQEGRINEECKRIKIKRDELTDRMNGYQNTIFRANQKMEELKKQMNWEQQALEAWLEESAHKDEDALTIAKYARADESKIKDLTLKLEQLHETAVKKKKTMDSEVTETLTAQIELDNTAEMFRQAHKERQQLIDQWEQTIHQMRRRDEDMDKTATELARLKAVIKTKETTIKEKEEFLDQEKQNNEEIEKKLTAAERQAIKNRQDYQDLEQSRVEIKDELESLKYSVNRTAADLESMRARRSQISRDIKDRQKRLDTVQHQRKIMQEELKKSTKKTLTAEERAHQMDRLLADEEEKVKALEKELGLQREKMFKKEQDLFEVKKKETNTQAEIQGGMVAVRNLTTKQNRLDEQALKQQELLYNQDFQLQQLEHKLSRLGGERTEDEKIHLLQRIKELEEEWDQQHQAEAVLRNQLKQLQDELRQTDRNLTKSHANKDVLMGKIDELNLHIDNTQRELRRVVIAKQELMVDENIIKLEVKRLRDGLFSRSDEVVSLEKQKLQLESAMAERSREINTHKDMLKAQIRVCEGERQTVSAELHNRIAKIDMLRKRYEIQMMFMSPPEGEEEHSQAYYVIKAAQDKEELQREGDILDSKISKAEKEIRALENTLALMNAKNEGYRKSLGTADPSSDEATELELLEGQLKAVTDKYRHRKKQVQVVETDLRSLTDALTTLGNEEETYSLTLEDKMDKLASLQMDLSELKAKKERASRQSTKLVKELRAKEGVTGKTSFEEDIELREMRDFSVKVLQQLGEIAANHPHLADTARHLLSQAGLPPPATPTGSRASSVASLSSARSSLSRGSTALSGRGSSVASTPRQPSSVHTKPVDIGGDLPDSARTTPRIGMSPRGSSTSLTSRGSKKSPARKQTGARPPSTPTSSRGSSSRLSSGGRRSAESIRSVK